MYSTAASDVGVVLVVTFTFCFFLHKTFFMSRIVSVEYHGMQRRIEWDTEKNIEKDTKWDTEKNTGKDTEEDEAHGEI